MPDPIHPYPVHLDSIQLRLIAEAASGNRGEPVYFVVLPDGTIAESKNPDVPESEKGLVIPAHTADRVPGKPPLTVATIEAEGAPEPVNLLDLPNGLGRADSVFWSESAVEKFLVPYYASVYGNQAAEAVADLLDAFIGDRRRSGSGGEAEGGRAWGTVEDVEVYAMAHIPKSEYVLLGSQSDIGRDVAVIYREKVDNGQSPLTALLLPDFLGRHRRRS